MATFQCRSVCICGRQSERFILFSSGDQPCSRSLAAFYDTTNITKHERCARQSSVSLKRARERMGKSALAGKDRS